MSSLSPFDQKTASSTILGIDLMKAIRLIIILTWASYSALPTLIELNKAWSLGECLKSMNNLPTTPE